MRVASLRLLGERPFALLWAGQATSAFGSALVPVALSFGVLGLTDSPSALGLVLTAAFVPRIALLLIGGVVGDRLPRRHVLLAAHGLPPLAQGRVAGRCVPRPRR